MRHLFTLAFAFVVAVNTLCAAVKPGMPFSDHMVLQAGVPVPVWGTATPAENITVQFGEQTKTTVADADGKWRVTLDPMPASTESRDMTVTSVSVDSSIHNPHSTLKISDVLVGEVWLCSGQSNMRFALGRKAEPRVEKAPLLFPASLGNSTNPRIRLLNVSGGTPANRKWGVCGPETATEFSAIGYFFGAALHQARDVPVGLVDLGQGGASIRVFIPQVAFDSKSEFAAPFKNSKARTGSRFTSDMIPFAPFAVRGVLWYQGESDAGRAAIYPELLRTMISEWRRTLESPSLPFLIVQLPPWERRKTDAPDKHPAANWPALRDAQAKFVTTEPHSALAVISDLGERFDIHPRRKREVGERLAQVARAKVYGEPVEHSGPVPVACVSHQSEIEITFKHAEGGLFAINGELENFEVAGEDGKFLPVKARVSAHDKLIITSPRDMTVKRVRYAWRDWFQPTLFNSSGWPAAPFETTP